MRILFLTQVLPFPPDAGPKIRSYYLLRWLAEQGHEITLVSFIRHDDSPEHVAHLRSLCQAVHTVPMRRSRLSDARCLVQSLLSGRSFIIARDIDRSMHTLVGRLITEETFNAVHSDQLWMAQYAVNCAGVTRVLDQHNAVYLIPQRLARNEANPLKRLVLEREWRALAAYEAAMCYRFDQVITVTEEDRALLSDLCNRNRLFITPRTDGRPFHVIPICVDPEERPLVRRHPDAKRVTILGTMFWPPNVEGVLWFTEQVWPLVLRTVPDAKLTIIGKNPPETVRQLALSPGSNVEVTGYVRNPVPFMEGSAVFAVPLRSAGGMRVKILDAWCWGVPIVSTTIGAEGVEVQDGENILIADAGPAFARVVVSVMQDPGLAERLRTAGRDWVEKKYNWRSIYSQWSQIYG